jgi:hypothetical protein
VPALLGRTFTPADDVRGGGKDGPVAVISYALWQRRFGGSGTIVGTPLIVERMPFTIIGVTPPAFFGAEVGRAFDVALPLTAEPLIHRKDSRINPQVNFYTLTVLLRLKADQSIEAANAIVHGVQPQIRDAAMPSTLPPQAQQEFLKEAFTLVPAATGMSRLRARYERPLVAIFVVVALVLLIACANIANLQVAHWGEERIANELLLKLGLAVSPRTVGRYIRSLRPQHGGRQSQRWATFVRNHAHAVVACDFFTVVTARFRVLYVFVVL